MRYKALVKISFEIEFDEENEDGSLVLEDKAFRAAMDQLPNGNHWDVSVSYVEAVPSQPE